MANDPYRRLRADDPTQNRVNESAATDLSVPLKCPILYGRLIERIALTNTANFSITHKLGRKPVGYIITRIYSGHPTFFEVSLDAAYLVVNSSTSSTIDLWIY